MGYSFRLAARVLIYAPSHRQDNTYRSLCYTSRGALAGTRNSSMCPPHEGSIRRPIAPWANALTTELHLAHLSERMPVNDVQYLPGPHLDFLLGQQRVILGDPIFPRPQVLLCVNVEEEFGAVFQSVHHPPTATLTSNKKQWLIRNLK